MLGMLAALLYGVLTLTFIVVLGLQIDSPLVVILVTLAAGASYMCQTMQLLRPDAWKTASFFWFSAIILVVLALTSAGIEIAG